MTENGAPAVLRNRPVVVGALVALVTALITTSFNDYLQFREQDAIHRLRIDQLKQEILANAVTMRRDIEQLQSLLTERSATYDTLLLRLSKQKDDFLQRIAALEAVAEQRKECDGQPTP